MAIFTPDLPQIICAGVNILAFALFASDKIRAKMSADRSPEKKLLAAAVIGPFGALAAMIVFHHKIRHGKFLLIPCFCILHLFLFLWLYRGVPG